MKNRTIQLMLAAVIFTTFAARAADPHDPGVKPKAPGVAKDDHDDHADPAGHAKIPRSARVAGHDDHDDHADAHDGHGDGHVDEVKLSAAAIKSNGIVLAPATKRSLASSFVASARVSFNSEAMAHVGSVAPGRVVEIKVRQGDAVKKGDVLLVVESPEFGRSQSAYLQRSTEAEVAAAAVGPAKDAHERVKKLLEESQGIALSEVQKREAEYRAAAGAAATSRAARDAAESELHLLGLTRDDVQKLTDGRAINPRLEVRAPIDGRIVEREVTLGELVAPEKDRLLVIADTSSVWVLADVPEARLGQVGVGSPAEIQAASMPGERIAGSVSHVSAEVNPATRAARVRIVVKNTHDLLKPGMFATALLTAAEAPQAVLAIPEEAVQTVEGKPSVFVAVKGEPNTFALRAVVVGRAVNGYVPIVSGIEEGDSLVTSGTFILKAELGKGSAEHNH